MLKCATVCLLAASAAAAPAKEHKNLKMKKNMRSIKSDNARVVKHLNALSVFARMHFFFSSPSHEMHCHLFCKSERTLCTHAKGKRTA